MNTGSGNLTVHWRNPELEWSDNQSYTISQYQNKYGTDYSRQIHRRSINLLSKAIQLKFSNSVNNEYFTVNNVKITYNLRSER